MTPRSGASRRFGGNGGSGCVRAGLRHSDGSCEVGEKKGLSPHGGVYIG